MHILIVYDSFFGNTHKIAEAIKSGFSSDNIVIVLNASDLGQEQIKKAELLIVGSPTRGFRPSPNTSKFLKSIRQKSLNGKKVAAFDTRINLETLKKAAFRFMVDKGGYAAKSISKQLVKKGGNLIVESEGFYVDGEQGPLTKGEIGRAATWAQTLESKIN